MDSHIRNDGLTKVQIIRRKNGMTMVEWSEDGTFRRTWLHPDYIDYEEGNVAWVQSPGIGIPFGVDWARIINLVSTPTDVDRELKRQGIWTVEDLRMNPDAALGAIKSALGLDLAALYTAAKEYERQLEV